MPGSGHESSTRKADFPRIGRIDVRCKRYLRCNAPRAACDSIDRITLATRGGDYSFFLFFFSSPKRDEIFTVYRGKKCLHGRITLSELTISHFEIKRICFSNSITDLFKNKTRRETKEWKSNRRDRQLITSYNNRLR